MVERIDFNKAGAGRGTGDHRWLHALNMLLLIALWAYSIGAYAGLPAEVPAHIGTHGVTRWAPRQNSPWFLLPIMATLNAALMYGVAAIANAGARGFNVPSKQRLLSLAPEGQRYAMQPMRSFMYGMATWVLVLLGYMQVRIHAFAVAGRDGAGSSLDMLAVTAVLLGIMIYMAVRLSRAITRRIGEWERQEAGARR